MNCFSESLCKLLPFYQWCKNDHLLHLLPSNKCFWSVSLKNTFKPINGKPTFLWEKSVYAERTNKLFIQMYNITISQLLINLQWITKLMFKFALYKLHQLPETACTVTTMQTLNWNHSKTLSVCCFRLHRIDGSPPTSCPERSRRLCLGTSIAWTTWNSKTTGSPLCSVSRPPCSRCCCFVWQYNPCEAPLQTSCWSD